jgi:hypothetical protein
VEKMNYLPLVAERMIDDALSHRPGGDISHSSGESHKIRVSEAARQRDITLAGASALLSGAIVLGFGSGAHWVGYVLLALGIGALAWRLR